MLTVQVISVVSVVARSKRIPKKLDLTNISPYIALFVIQTYNGKKNGLSLSSISVSTLIVNTNLKNKFRYTWRLFILSDKLPFQNTPQSVKLTNAHSPIHIVATAIYFSINIALSSTVVCGVPKIIFGIQISHKTIDNWKYAAANLLYNFFFTSKIHLPKSIVIDETYISISGKTHYLYTALTSDRRQVLAFFLSNKRNGNAAFNLLQLIAHRAVDKTLNCQIFTDGAPFYPPAIYCANLLLGTNFSHNVIIGLKNIHPHRTFKNMIERFWSTFHDSYKSHHGLKCFDATIAHIILFFSYYNFFRPHLSLDYSVPVVLDNINPNHNAIKNWLSLLSQDTCSFSTKT
jgi:transposase-like protein